MNLIEQLEALPQVLAGEGPFYDICVKLSDVRAIIEQAKREAVEPVAVPDHTKLIWELFGVLERAQNGFKWFVNEHPDDVDEDDIKLQLDIDALLTKALESIK